MEYLTILKAIGAILGFLGMQFAQNFARKSSALRPNGDGSNPPNASRNKVHRAWVLRRVCGIYSRFPIHRPFRHGRLEKVLTRALDHELPNSC